MEERIVKFIAALRVSGVRVSVAESQDAWRAIEYLGVVDRESFRLSLRSTLIKDLHALPVFDELFGQFFGAGAPPLMNPAGDLSPEEQQMLQQLLEQLAQDLSQLLDWLLNGEGPTQEELEQLAEQARIDQMSLSPSAARRAARRMQQILGWQQLQDVLEMLWEKLAEMGMEPDAIEQLKQQVAENQARLAQQLGDFAGQRIQENAIEEARHQKPLNDLMDRSFSSLSEREMDVLRDEVRRLAQRLRTQAALRQRRGKQGKLDPKATIRTNLRYGGVPFEMQYRERRLKPKLAVILDVSTSMRPVAEFFLRMIYELQDQVQKTRSFAFIDHLEEVSPDMAKPIDEAVYVVLTKLPSGHYNTNLGYSLQQFEEHYLDAVDNRTTVIVLGDARNNYNDPNIEAFTRIGRRSRKTIWMNPEYPAQWGRGDSDMPAYAPLCDAIFQVRNLSQLTQAVDSILI